MNRTPPEIKKIPEVLNFDNEYLCARQPRVGFAIPNTTPLIRATISVTRLVIHSRKEQ